MFKLTQNKRDKKLLVLVAKFMNCGTVYYHGENAFDFTVSKFADNQNIITPMFKTYPNQEIKQLEYQDFCKVAVLIDKGKHLTD
jgi:LAGLIDADG DNA endonuclease family protein